MLFFTTVAGFQRRQLRDIVWNIVRGNFGSAMYLIRNYSAMVNPRSSIIFQASFFGCPGVVK